MTASPTESSDPIVRRLAALAHESPDLDDAARLYQIILPLLRDSDLCVRPVTVGPEQARAKLEAGVPLLNGVDLELDTRAAAGLMRRLARVLETAGQDDVPRRIKPTHAAASAEGAVSPRAEAGRQIRTSLQDGRLDLAALLPQVAAGDRAAVTRLAHKLGLDAGLVWTLAQITLRPALRAWRRQLAPLVELVAWRQGYCPVCGGTALLAELQDNNQVKHLRCGECGGDWPFGRLQCPYCGNDDHRTLATLYSDQAGETTRGHETMRAEVCEHCHGYLKVIAAFSPTPPEMLAVEDLATLHLDFIAQERGYKRTTIPFP